MGAWETAHFKKLNDNNNIFLSASHRGKVEKKNPIVWKYPLSPLMACSFNFFLNTRSVN